MTSLNLYSAIKYGALFAIILIVQIWAYYLFELVGLRLCLERECTNVSKCFIRNENELLTYNISMFYKILQYNPGGLPLDDSP